MFMDCPKCGTEFIMKQDQDMVITRCPDCLQTLDNDLDGKGYVKAYYGSSQQSYDDYDTDSYRYDY